MARPNHIETLASFTPVKDGDKMLERAKRQPLILEWSCDKSGGARPLELPWYVREGLGMAIKDRVRRPFQMTAAGISTITENDPLPTSESRRLLQEVGIQITSTHAFLNVLRNSRYAAVVDQEPRLDFSGTGSHSRAPLEFPMVIYINKHPALHSLLQIRQ